MVEAWIAKVVIMIERMVAIIAMTHTPPSSSSRTYTPNLLTPSKKKTCTVTIGNEYYEFDPDNTNDVNLQFSDKSGKVEIDCD